MNNILVVSADLTSSSLYPLARGPKTSVKAHLANLDHILDPKKSPHPIDQDLRHELVCYGELIEAAYRGFQSNPISSPNYQHHPIFPLPNPSYRITRSLFATSSINLPWVAQHSSCMGYVAVSNNNKHKTSRISRRRNIAIVLRGTTTCLEWTENLRADLVPIEKSTAYKKPLSQFFGDTDSAKNLQLVPKVAHGFLSLYKTPGTHVPSLSTMVLEEVVRLMEQYRGEELSITVTGHSLGAALAVLVGDEIGTLVSPAALPVSVFSFGGPRVGNQGFRNRVEGKVVRVSNEHDIVTKVPGLLMGYSHVGKELRIRSQGDLANCHDLETYLHVLRTSDLARGQNLV